MKPIRIFTPDLEFLTEIDDYEALIFTRRWHRPGEFQLQINRHKQNTDKLQKGNIIVLGKEPAKAGFIVNRQIGLDEQGKVSEQWNITGHALAAAADWRITIPQIGQEHDSVTGTAETVMKHYIDAHFINPVDAARKIDYFTLAVDKGRGINMEWQSRFKSIAAELEKISLSSGMGWNIYPDFNLKKWVFEVFEGRDLTAGQTENPPVIFSTDIDAIKGQRYAESNIGYKNFAYVGGQGEGVDRTIVEVGTATGAGRREVFIDARDVAEAGALQVRGQQRLSELNRQTLFEAEVLTYGPFIYGQDWDLGDIVTIQSKDWGVTLNTRIIEVKEIYEPSGFRLEAVFGNTWPTLTDRIKAELEQISAEVRR